MNEKEIQLFQSQIDELNDLCGEVLSISEEGDSHKERLGVMILKMQDEVLEPRYVRRLEKWLLSDPKALEYYIDFALLSANLYLHFHPEAGRKALAGLTAPC